MGVLRSPVELAKEQVSIYPWLPDALESCVSCRHESKAYTYFVNATNANKEGSVRQFEKNIILEHMEHGTIVLDILEGNRVGGVEFLNQL
jgi:hypothetical protein